MAKCVKCGTSGLTLKLDSRGLCESCQFLERTSLNDRIKKLEDELEPLRSFYERYKWVPVAEDEAAKLIENANLRAKEMLDAISAEAETARNEFEAYKSAAELELASKREALDLQAKRLKNQTNTVVAQTKEQLAALFAIAAKDFSFSAKTSVGASFAAEQKAAKKRTPGTVVFDLKTISSSKANFTMLTPAAFKRAAAHGYIVFDLETTGLSRTDDKIIEIAAIKFDEQMQEIDRFSTLVNPGISIPPQASAINHITDAMVQDAPRIYDDCVLPEFLSFVSNFPLIAHNAEFDIGFLRTAVSDAFSVNISCGDSLAMCKKIYSLSSYRLESVASYLGFGAPQSHRAMGDCEMLAFVLKDLLPRL